MQESIIKTANGLNANATSILFIMSVMLFSCLHVHNICANLFVSSMNIALVSVCKQMQFFTTTTYLQMVIVTGTNKHIHLIFKDRNTLF